MRPDGSYLPAGFSRTIAKSWPTVLANTAQSPGQLSTYNYLLTSSGLWLIKELCYPVGHGSPGLQQCLEGLSWEGIISIWFLASVFSTKVLAPIICYFCIVFSSFLSPFHLLQSIAFINCLSKETIPSPRIHISLFRNTER